MNHHNDASEIMHLTQEVEKLNTDDVLGIYGIVLGQDGKVFDPMYDMHFGTIGEWASFSIEQDSVEYSEHIYSGEYDYE